MPLFRLAASEHSHLADTSFDFDSLLLGDFCLPVCHWQPLALPVLQCRCNNREWARPRILRTALAMHIRRTFIGSQPPTATRGAAESAESREAAKRAGREAKQAAREEGPTGRSQKKTAHGSQEAGKISKPLELGRRVSRLLKVWILPSSVRWSVWPALGEFRRRGGKLQINIRGRSTNDWDAVARGSSAGMDLDG